MTAIEIAYQKASSGRPGEGRAVLEAAARSGDATAFAELGYWFLRGDIIARDVAAARACFGDASAMGDVDATMMAAALGANGSGGAADWPGAMALLRRAARTSDAAAAQLALLERMALDAEGAPTVLPTPRQISVRPAVWHVEGLFAPDECRHVAMTAAGLLEPATVIDPATGRNIVNPVRTSDTALIGPTQENLVVRALNRRVAALTRTDIAQGEALTVLRYSPGQRFRPHVDALPHTTNQRVKTVLIYLNQGFAGGATTFPHAGLRIAPRAGDAVIFDNVDPHGAIDDAALHEGEAVVQGVKWLATRWIRARSFDVWQGPEASV